MPGSNMLLKEILPAQSVLLLFKAWPAGDYWKRHKIDANYIDSLVFFEEGSFYVSSNAALRTLSYFDGWERHLIFLSVVPRSLRDLVYRFIARNRYKWFGRREQCMVPTAELSKRFLPD